LVVLVVTLHLLMYPALNPTTSTGPNPPRNRHPQVSAFDTPNGISGDTQLKCDGAFDRRCSRYRDRCRAAVDVGS
jgi:hypothetical protein